MSGTAPPEWSYAEYARMPDDGNRYEVLDGEVLVTPSPGTRHQRIAAEVFVHLREYIRREGIGEMLWDLDLLFATGQFLRPDMVFVPNAQRHLLTERGVEGVPGLVVEVVSPGSVRIDKVTKPARYADFGVPEYWVVDPDRRAVLVWNFEEGASEPRIETEHIVWH
ncbi:MAG: Uma2 family endonuclease, partial [Planctomycetaceae bacterium]